MSRRRTESTQQVRQGRTRRRPRAAGTRLRALAVSGVLLALAAPAWASEGGLEIFPDLRHLLELCVLFVLLVVPVNRLVLRPLLGVLDERTARIDGTRKRASEVAGEADAALARYRAAVEAARKDAGEMRKEALEKARNDQVRILAEARKAAEAEVMGARSGVSSALEGARATLRTESSALAREAAARVLGRVVS